MSRVGVSGAGALFVGDGSGIVRAWDWRRAGAGALASAGAHAGAVLSVAPLSLARSDVAASAGVDGTVRVLSLDGGDGGGARLRGHLGPVVGVAADAGFSSVAGLRESIDAAGGNARARTRAGRDTVRVSPSRASEMVSPRAGTRAREATSPSRRGVWTGSSGYGADPRPGLARAPGTRPARGTTGDGDASGRRRRTAPRSPPSNSHRAVSTGRDSSPPRGILPSRCGPRRRRCAASGGRRGRAKEPEEPGPRPGRFTKRNRTRNRTARGRRPPRAVLTRAETLWGTRAVAGRRARGGGRGSGGRRRRCIGEWATRARAQSRSTTRGGDSSRARETVPSRAPGCPRRRGG